ncbi:hypothetical protein IMZ08_07100 [Bacillus luteolus]|uniref:ATP synthase F0 subunit 8 n=1 Tax=Litchfieldia luteola TaxID=682179 RepID=A0ABR9QH50_9BACI|nr:hypothetical protein [Cytobacillus luteolus]MBE4907819.1 hypothetical protein [Cytobacillus luteolus]MBP1944024.1 Mg2+ and Co2+ transporter CorA [Cytobacillus luteolus]
MLKNIMGFFHFEMVVTVIPGLVFGYLRWDLPLYLCIGIFVLCIILYSYFKKKYKESKGANESL